MCIAIACPIQAQKGAISIAAGPLISIPVGLNDTGKPNLKPGAGLVIIGQYNLSDKGALLLQTSLAAYGNSHLLLNYTGQTIFISSIYGGYKYGLGSAGYFINGLAGFSSYSIHAISYTDFVVGAGKRITIKEAFFIDAGVDFVFGDTDNRFNIKAVFSLLRRPKVK